MSKASNVLQRKILLKIKYFLYNDYQFIVGLLMNEEYNIYCDESCHLEKDYFPAMLMGSIWCPRSQVRTLSNSIMEIKKKHKMQGELKWSKISKSKEGFYLELIKWFFNTSDINFRCLIIVNKLDLDHEKFNSGSHDDFYYKMYFSLLNKILSPDKTYNIYLDIKDTRSNMKLKKLKEILCHDHYDFTYQMINNLQNIRSHESHLLQMADFLIGALSYKWRELSTNETKLKIINLLESDYKKNLKASTSLFEKKFNLFVFTPRVKE